MKEQRDDRWKGEGQRQGIKTEQVEQKRDEWKTGIDKSRDSRIETGKNRLIWVR